MVGGFELRRLLVDNSQTLLVSMYCPKCGHKIIGKKREDGFLALQCDRCKAVMVSRPKGTKVLNIKVVLANTQSNSNSRMEALM